MNKVVIFFSVILLSLSVSSQVRLNEMFPANNGQNKQWIELFSSGASLSNYTLAIRYKLNTTDSGFYLLSLSGTANVSNYFVVENNGNVNWINTSQVKKVSWAGVPQVLTVAESNQILQSSGENFIFLVKYNRVVDVLVTGVSGGSTPYLKAQSAINAWTSFSAPSGIGLDGFSLAFNYVQLTNLNTPNQSAGAGSSFSFIYSLGGCTADYPWVKTSSETKGTLNSGSSTPQFDYWEAAYKISNAFAKQAADFYVVTNSRIPDGSPTFDYNAAGSPTKLYFKYTVLNTLITVALANPVFYMYYDKGGLGNLPNGVLDATDPVVVSGMSKTLETSNTIYLNMAITQDMFYTNAQGYRKLRPFFLVLVSQNTCFKTQDILISEQLFALPVTLGSFDVKPRENGNLLQWSSLSEFNNTGFEVQQSVGHANGFTTIGFVDSKAKNGNSQAEIRYAFEDKTPVNGAVVYYRLKQIDMDGKSSYSDIKAIKVGMGSAALQVYPNPSSGSISIQTGIQGKQKLLLLDQQGMLVRSTDHTAGPLKIHGLKTGVYVLKLMGEGGEMMTRKIIVQ
jgi:hypothetical protein